MAWRGSLHSLNSPLREGSLHALNFKMTREDYKDENEKSIEKKVDAGTEKKVKGETLKKQKEEITKKYEDPVTEDYQREKENRYGKKNIHKKSWDIGHFDDEIV